MTQKERGFLKIHTRKSWWCSKKKPQRLPKEEIRGIQNKRTCRVNTTTHRNSSCAVRIASHQTKKNEMLYMRKGLKNNVKSTPTTPPQQVLPFMLIWMPHALTFSSTNWTRVIVPKTSNPCLHYSRHLSFLSVPTPAINECADLVITAL